MIVAEGLTKRYGATTAVDGMSFRVEPGRVTGFLGPNGAGKSTTMRMVVGLDRPTAGRVTVGGHAYVDAPAPLREVGALLEARALHPGRSARDHLRALGATHGIGAGRVDEVLETVGLTGVARRRAGGFSLGMGQRLGIAAALLGDPRVLVLDEPVNGLDPEGVRWVRQTVRRLADEGRTVLVSSHLMAEMAMTADDLVVVGRGRVVATGTVAEVVASVSDASVVVRSPRAADVAAAVHRAGGRVEGGAAGAPLVVRGLDAARVGDLAAAEGLPLHELTPRQASLEDAFMTLTAGDVEYASAAAPATSGRTA